MLSPHGHVHGQHFAWASAAPRTGVADARGRPTHSFRSSRHVMVSPISGALDDCVCEGHRQQRMSGWSAWGRKKLPDARLRTLTLCAPPRISTERAQSILLHVGSIFVTERIADPSVTRKRTVTPNAATTYP